MKWEVKKMRISKKKLILPGVVFFVGILILSGMVCNIRNNKKIQKQTNARLNAMTYAERMKTEINEGIGVTDTLKQILVSEDGKIEKFPQIAEDMMTDSIQSIQLAPEGVVTDIYPEKGNEAGKIDLIHDKDRGEISRYARDYHVFIMQGPFDLKQGGRGIAVRNPVYLEDKDGKEQFWGFTIAIIRVPDIFSDSVQALSDFGYHYRLTKTVSPLQLEYTEVDSSGGKLTDPVAYSFEMGGDQWKLEVSPEHGWTDSQYSRAVLLGGIIIVLLLTGLTYTLLGLDEQRKKFKKLAVTDALTGIYNRHGFDAKVTQYLKQHSTKPCVGVQFDIDDFKFINDMYGHASGDLALQVLAEGMQDFFPESALLGRNGGDEFCIFLPNCTGEEAAARLMQFTQMRRTFPYEGEEHAFTISLGYAEYPKQAKNHAQLMRCADAALYEVKLRGKHGCLAYRSGFRQETRSQLGFALKDVSENLPAAFVIYKADDEAQILFANHEMMRLAGCKNMDAFLDYTDRSFKNLIRDEERDAVEKSIRQQIEEEGHSNHYVEFDLKKQDGTYLHILDHGRIVENGRYGKVFYVLLMDQKSMKRHYGD